jgi:hypothetical protein
MDAPTRKRKTAQTDDSEHQAKKSRTTVVPGYTPAPLRNQRKELSFPSLAERTSANTAGEQRPAPILPKEQSSPLMRKSANVASEQRPAPASPEEQSSSPLKRTSADTASEQRPAPELPEETALSPSPPKRKSANTAGERHPAPALPEEQSSSPSKRESADAASEQRPANGNQVERVQTGKKSASQPQSKAFADKSEDSLGKLLRTALILTLLTYLLIDITPPTLSIFSSNLNPPPESSYSRLLEEDGETQASLRGSRTTLTKNKLDAKQRSHRSFHDLAKLARKPRPEDAGALSDCEDDEEWNRRYKRMVSDLNPVIRDPGPSSSFVKLTPDSKAMFVVKHNVSVGLIAHFTRLTLRRIMGATLVWNIYHLIPRLFHVMKR